MKDLPKDLMKNISDSEVEVLSWSAESQELKLLIEKELGPESGIITFSGVSLVHMPPRISLESISIVALESEYLKKISLQENENIYLLNESWGDEFYVVAESIEYDINV